MVLAILIILFLVHFDCGMRYKNVVVSVMINECIFAATVSDAKGDVNIFMNDMKLK